MDMDRGLSVLRGLQDVQEYWGEFIYQIVSHQIGININGWKLLRQTNVIQAPRL